ncbi:hypothetical protein ABT324_26125 [Saccharopolyspora sp. NPDC000359]|uniref:scabin-related ADP-ribosyltransferase n=1 Tax=Saccharopolyspora sp. NPDC000359 TaxID=3154251 RepID=UPI00331C466E
MHPDSFSNVRHDEGRWGLGQQQRAAEERPGHDRSSDAANSPDQGAQKYSTAESMAAERPPANPSEHRWDIGRAGEFERLDVSPELRQKLAGDDGYTGIRNTPSGLSVVHYPKSMIGDRAYYDRVPKPAVDPKRFTVEVHGSPDGVEFRGQQLSAKELAEIIKAAPGYDPGTPIRLLSCKTGADTPDGSPNFAQQLSKELGVEVLAPNKDAWVDNFGNMYASDSRAKFEPDAAGTPQPKLDEPGQWISFAPDGTKATHDSPFPPGHEPEFTRHGVQAHNAEQRGIGDVFRKMFGLEKKPDTFETDPVTGERHPAPHQAYTQHPQNGQPPFQQPQPGQSPNLPQEWQRQPQAPAQQGQMPYQQGQQPPAVQQQQAGPYPQQQPGPQSYPQQPQGGYPQQQGGYPQQSPQNGPGFGQQQPGPSPQGMSNQPGGPQYQQGVGNNQGGPQYPQGAGNQPGGPQYQQGGGYPQPQHPGGMHQQAPGQPQPPVAQPPRGPQQSGPTPPPAAQPPRGPQQPQGMPQQSGRPTFNGPGPQGPHTPAHGPQGPRSQQAPGQPAPRPYDVSDPRQNQPGPTQPGPYPNVGSPRRPTPPLDVSGPRMDGPSPSSPNSPIPVGHHTTPSTGRTAEAPQQPEAAHVRYEHEGTQQTGDPDRPGHRSEVEGDGTLADTSGPAPLVNKEPDYDDPLGHVSRDTELDQSRIEQSLVQGGYERRQVVWRTDRDLLYRHDNRPPEEVFAEARGFQGRGDRVNLHQHLDMSQGQIVATTRSYEHARDRAMAGPSREESYVYEIDAPGGVDIAAMNLGTRGEDEVGFVREIDVRFIKTCIIIDPKTGDVIARVPNPHYWKGHSR